MCYDSTRYQWACRAARIQAEVDRAEAQKAAGKGQKATGQEKQPEAEAVVAWFRPSAFILSLFR